MPNLPGWNSLPAVTRYHGWAEIAGIVILAFLVAAEVISYQYGHRKDKLASIEQEAAEQAHKDEITRLQHEAARLSQDAETLRQKNLDMEAAVSPRIIEQNLTAEALKKWAGVPFVVINPSDFEPKRTAGQIRFIVEQAKWTRFTEPLPHPFNFPDGVAVHVMGNVAELNDPANVAAAALIALLNENSIQARQGYPLFFLNEDGKPIFPVPGAPERPNVIIVEVGPKPLPPSMRLDPLSVRPDKNGGRTFGNIAE